MRHSAPFARRDESLAGQISTARNAGYPCLPLADLADQLARAQHGRLVAIAAADAGTGEPRDSRSLAVFDDGGEFAGEEFVIHAPASASTGAGSRARSPERERRVAGIETMRYYRRLDEIAHASEGLYDSATLHSWVERHRSMPYRLRSAMDYGRQPVAVRPGTGRSQKARHDYTLTVGGVALALRAGEPFPIGKAATSRAYDVAVAYLGLGDLPGSRDYVRQAVKTLRRLIDSYAAAA